MAVSCDEKPGKKKKFDSADYFAGQANAPKGKEEGKNED